MGCREDALLAYDEAMVEEGFVELKEAGDGARVFLSEIIVVALLDQDQDGMVTRSELYSLQVGCWAVSVSMGKATRGVWPAWTHLPQLYAWPHLPQYA